MPKPEFTYLSWFAMLFSAGMGIGLLFYGVAEPMFHYVANPLSEPGTVESAKAAMELTFLHWGFHPWGIYALIGLGLAFFGFTEGAAAVDPQRLLPGPQGAHLRPDRQHHRHPGHDLLPCSAWPPHWHSACSRSTPGLAHLFGIPQNPTCR
jgi:hypothetical protein